MNDRADAPLRLGFHLFEQAASIGAQRVDVMLGALVLLCGLVSLAITVLIVFFSIRYRANAAVDRSNPPSNARRLELAWVVTPLVIFLGIFGWSAVDYARLEQASPNALPVYVVAKQWMWKLQHRNGRREINELHVPLGQPVKLIMTSQDVIHSFFVPVFRVKQDVLPGRYTTLSFTATEPGEFNLFCAEYCGAEHSGMIGRVVVMQPDAFARWLDAGTQHPGLAQQGFALFRKLGCSGCHTAGSTVNAPMLDGLLGRVVHLQDGSSLVADETYVRDSILLPRKQVVAGFAPVMPSFAGQVSEEDIQALIAYLRSTQTKGGKP